MMIRLGFNNGYVSQVANLGWLGRSDMSDGHALKPTCVTVYTLLTYTYHVSQRCNCYWIGKDLPIEIKNLGTEWGLQKVVKDSTQGFI